MDRLLIAALVAAAFGLSGCGDTDLERGATGAAIGAVAASATSNSPIVGAAVGAGAGVLCDNVTPQLCH